MRQILNLFYDLSGSMGLAICLLAVAISILLTPLRYYASGLEQRLNQRTALVSADVARIDKSLKGEERFNHIEAVYKKHGYHPIQSTGLGASLFVMLPVFLSAIVLLDNTTVGGHSFLFIGDLGHQDGLLFEVNLLPLIMTAITLIDAQLRFGSNRGALLRFSIIAVVLLILTYTLSSGMILYWIISNLVVLGSFFLRSITENKK